MQRIRLSRLKTIKLSKHKINNSKSKIHRAWSSRKVSRKLSRKVSRKVSRPPRNKQKKKNQANQSLKGIKNNNRRAKIKVRRLYHRRAWRKRRRACRQSWRPTTKNGRRGSRKLLTISSNK